MLTNKKFFGGGVVTFGNVDIGVEVAFSLRCNTGLGVGDAEQRNGRRDPLFPGTWCTRCAPVLDDGTCEGCAFMGCTACASEKKENAGSQRESTEERRSGTSVTR
ncbi:hypothetical protein K0M31_017552 [Melipona bicolor]|uniref:Uncharacterized protein n=1 Tax=Melipona bicolor TaxID=60889 RepID=A0AA40KSJ5_9HYME|nr:hypothetical protein K0M31_017552 [Melipona bicolor]